MYTKIIQYLSKNESKLFYRNFLSLNYNLQSFLSENPEVKYIFSFLVKNKVRKFLLELYPSKDSSEKIDESSEKIDDVKDITSSGNVKNYSYTTDSEFLRLLYISLTNFLMKPQRLMVDNSQYYVACDTYTKTYYICYKHLLMCDIDFYKDNFGNVINDAEICDYVDAYSKQHNLTFRVYRSRNGFHVFLTSKRMDCKSEESYRIMSDLKCDFYYILYSKIRGWSVRLNKKDQEVGDSLYKFEGKYGTEPEDIHLVALVDLHLLLAQKFIQLDNSLIYNG